MHVCSDGPWHYKYNFKVKYRPGSIHQNADGLSRQAWDADQQLLKSSSEKNSFLSSKEEGDVEGHST